VLAVVDNLGNSRDNDIIYDVILKYLTYSMANVKVISFLQSNFVCIFTKLNNFKHSRNFVRRNSRGGGLQRGA